jgi:hypothetical protein
MEQLMPESVRTGKYLPMPYSVPEVINIEDGEPFHDIRPLVYSIAPWMSAITNLGVRRLPFGIALRPTKYLDEIENYVYLNGEIDIQFEGEGKSMEILVNGQILEGSFQVPDELVKEGDNSIVIRMGHEKTGGSLLASSTVKLLRITDGVYTVKAYGKNILTFKDLEGKVTIKDASGQVVSAESQIMDDLTYLEFEGRGIFTIEI